MRQGRRRSTGSRAAAALPAAGIAARESGSRKAGRSGRLECVRLSGRSAPLRRDSAPERARRGRSICAPARRRRPPDGSGPTSASAAERAQSAALRPSAAAPPLTRRGDRSEEHTSELQSRLHLVCRLLLEKKKKKKQTNATTDT